MTEIIKHKKESPLLGLTGAGGGLTGLVFGGAVITPDGQSDYLAAYDGVSGFSGGTFSWLCPPGVTSVSVVCIGGGGGGGGGALSTASGGGGGACAYKNNISVTPGTSYTVVVGSGKYNGTNTESDGGDSYFGSTSTVMAKGGESASDSGYNGGSAANSVGDGKYAGGNGGSGNGEGGHGGESSGTDGGSGGWGGSGISAAGSIGQSGSGGGGGYSGSNTNGCASGGLAPVWNAARQIGAGGGGGATRDGSNLGKGGGGGGGGTVGNYVQLKAPLDGYGTPYCQAGSHFDLRIGGYGGYFGGGGGAHGLGIVLWSGGHAGAVRIIWSTSGLTRAYPSTNIRDSDV